MALSDAKYPIDTQNQLSQLFFAIERRCDDKIEQILESGFDVNHVIRSSKNPSLIGWTALHHACNCQNITAAKILLKFGADFTAKDQNGYTALRLCMKFIKENINVIMDLIKMILDAHVNTDVRTNPADNYNLSHFHIAYAAGHNEAVSFFKKFCPVDDFVHSDSPILPNFSPSSNLKHSEVLELLYEEKSLGVHSTEYSFDSSVMIEKEREEMIKRCSEWFPENVPSNPVDNFMKVCVKGSSEELEKLLQSKTVDILQEDIAVKALYLASHAESIDNVKILINHGADFYATYDGNYIPDLCIRMFGWKFLELLALIDPLDESCELEKKAREFCIAALNPWNKNVTMTDYLSKSSSKFNEFINSSCMSINSRIWRGATPLHVFAKFTFDDDKFYNGLVYRRLCDRPAPIVILRRLLDYGGADYTVQDAEGRTPLHEAVHSGCLKVAKEILNKCRQWSQINLIDDTGLSPLHVACLLGDDSAVTLLRHDEVKVNTRINRNIKVNEKLSFSSGSTPLHAAVINHNWRTVESLIEKNADIFAEDDDGLTPIHYVAMYYEDKEADDGWRQITDELFSHPDIKNKNPICTKEGLSHLQVACATDKVEVIEALVKLGADVNAPPPYSVSKNKNMKKNVFTNNTPLHIAYHFDQGEVLEALAKQGMNFNVPNDKGLSCLHMALANWLEGCPRQKIKRVLDLMKFNWKDTRPIDKTGLTQLHVACALGLINSVKKLVQAGASVNKAIPSKSPFLPGLTPLLAAVMFCKFKSKEQYIVVMKILLGNGANPLFKTVDNDTVIHRAYKLRKPELAALMLTYGKTVRSNPKDDVGLSHFHIACAVGSQEVVKKFLSYGVDVNEPISIFFNGWDKSTYEQASKFSSKTPLHFAINVENDSCKSILTTLLSKGANPNAQDRKGWTPLHYACDTDNTEIVKTLLGSDETDANSTDVYGDTALYTALRRPKVNKEIIRLLLSRGISVDPKSFEHAVQKADSKLLTQIVNSSKDISFIDKTGANAVHMIVKASVPPTQFDRPERSIKRNISSRIMIDHSIEKEKKKASQRYTSIDKDKLTSLTWSLAKKDVDLDAQNLTGQTPLHIAVSNCHNEAVEALLSNGADFEIADFSGVTATQLAAKRFSSTVRVSEKHLDIFESVGKTSKQRKYLNQSIPSLGILSHLRIGTSDETDPVEKVMMQTTVISKDLTLFDILTSTGFGGKISPQIT
ncbi:hypothetical protein QAD02_004465 [Eretmocerus hayati]|uniref:Uncharacterized protein n=1 Tax=Eretmocerus hayati TaxID=131215 RepID=A0ACC2NQW9_9HYME|nr:hypothetical protein QAD02_004465 [Eretmocerus hayati]